MSKQPSKGWSVSDPRVSPPLLDRDPRPLPPGHPASLPEAELLAQCTIGKGRSSGPGGQHRNKVETMVILLHVPSGVQVHADERRSAVENRKVAIHRLRLALATEVRTPPIPRDAWGDVRSDLWRSRVSREGRISCSPSHRDYPAMLAEAMDVIAASGNDVKKAALRLSCSMSQLLKLVKDHPPALAKVNAFRRDRGKHTLK